MFCPNCGHKVDPSQKFCDNCGAALKKRSTSADLNTDELHQSEEDDTIRSLSDIEAELKATEKGPESTPAPKETHYTQAPAQQKAYDSVREAPVKPAEPKHTEPAHHYDPVKTYERTKSDSADTLDDRTMAYNKNDFRQAEKVYHDPYTNKPYKPAEDPFKPTKSELKKQQKEKQKEKIEKQSDGLFSNMLNFARNNSYLSIFAVIITAILLVFKRNYGWIALAVFILLWFLMSQFKHGKEVGLNKRFSHSNEDDDEPADNVRTSGSSYDQPREYQHTERPAKQKKEHKVHDASRGKNSRQILIIISSIVGFISSVSGPFINGVSLSSTIASAANYTANLGAQTTLIMNASSAIRLICFISPVIALIAACFRSHGSIRIVRIFTVLPTIIYALVYGIFSSGAVNSAAITGQTAIGGTAFGYSFYILLITSIISLFLAYTLRPRIR
ncbi:zinc-ribbon domain-containing protein [Companilactobacillus keshanensis]|uniref:Zinc-ribbon domain-containing protein n=1 Tax=Companilactobacillus keshanensis TaxID=2486003 RepID=A0ABW4BSY9_9LACO|nr:zinc-ribbon domain-containing protein [Companilactobacillus keshanensis]